MRSDLARSDLIVKSITDVKAIERPHSLIVTTNLRTSKQ